MGDFHRPGSLRAVVDALATARDQGVAVTLLAGCTDWMVERHLGHGGNSHGDDHGLTVDLTGVEELTRVQTFHGDDGRPWLALGAGVTYQTLRTHPVLASAAPLLGAMAADVGAVQIQARGTLGGNLATGSPAADGVPVLVALGAVVRLASATGTREVPVEAFYTGYRRTVRRVDEVIASVAFPVPGKGARWHWRKVGTRRAQSISKVALAAVAEVRDGVMVTVRAAMASVGPTVALLPTVRGVLAGRTVSAVDRDALAAAVRSDITPMDDVRSTRAYRVHVAERTVLRMVETWRVSPGG